MSGGQVNPAQGIAFTVTDAVSDAGLIVAMATSATYTATLAGSTDEPIGYTFTNSVHPVTGESQTNQKVAIMALIEGQIIECVLPATHEAIGIGDTIGIDTSGAGKVAKKTSGWLIGKATEAKAQNAGGYIKVRVSKRYEA